MADYLVPVAEARDNIVVSHDGSVWANYLLRGINVVPYRTESLGQAQKLNEALFTALSTMPTTEVYLGGIKVRTDPEELVQRCISGLKSVTTEQFPALAERLGGWYQAFLYGTYKEFRRVYFLSIRVPTGATGGAKAFAKAGIVNPVGSVDWDKATRLSREYLHALPQAFRATKAGPQHLRWMHDRMRLRGLEVPIMPGPEEGFNPKSLAQVMVNKVADTEPVLDAFLREVDGHAPQKIKSGRRAEWKRNYRAARWGQALQVYNPELRTDVLPDGPSALQSMLAISGYPRRPKAMVNTFTYLVDQDLGGADADFALRMRFTQDLVGADHARGFESTLEAEADANATDKYDSAEYGTRADELARMYGDINVNEHAEPSPRGMQVTAVFAVAHPERKRLTQVMAALRQRLEANKFSVLHPVGGQFDLLQQMLPCVATSPLVDDLAGATTTRKFAACMPVRRTEIGDSIGVPFAINKENQLGQVVFVDLAGSTDKGNGSIALTGSQGGGKSYTIKHFIDWLVAMLCPTTIIDQGGEYLVFARSLGAVQSVEMKYPSVSFDPLKVFADDPALAKQVFMEVVRALCGFGEGSEEMNLLSRMLDPKMRRTYRLNSSREVLDRLRQGTFSDQGKASERLAAKLSYWAGIGYSAALFDPISEDGKVRVLPAFQRSRDASSVVFLTDGLPLHRGALTEDTDSLARYSVVLHTVMAWVTRHDFAQRRDVLCALVADEVAFWEESKAMTEMIGEPDKTGRKDRNIVIAGGQLADYFNNPAFAQVRKKVMLRQDRRVNAQNALVWGDIPPTEKLVTRMVNDTSPSDPDRHNLPVLGREGEGWFNDGYGGIARIQTLPMITSAGRRYADTTSSRMIHRKDLDGGSDQGQTVAADRRRLDAGVR